MSSQSQQNMRVEKLYT